MGGQPDDVPHSIAPAIVGRRLALNQLAIQVGFARSVPGPLSVALVSAA